VRGYDLRRSSICSIAIGHVFLGVNTRGQAPDVAGFRSAATVSAASVGIQVQLKPLHLGTRCIPNITPDADRAVSFQIDIVSKLSLSTPFAGSDRMATRNGTVSTRVCVPDSPSGHSCSGIKQKRPSEYYRSPIRNAMRQILPNDYAHAVGRYGGLRLPKAIISGPLGGSYICSQQNPDKSQKYTFLLPSRERIHKLRDTRTAENRGALEIPDGTGTMTVQGGCEVGIVH
jgi:hypothetical protein